jgi:integrase
VRKRLTDQFVRSVKPSGGQADFWDETLTGFGLRVSTKGKKTFQILYRHNRIQRRMTLGRFQVLSLADARKLARQTLGDAARGLDPASLKSANRNAETFAQLADDYLTLHAKRRKRSWREDERVIKGELLPWWKSRKAKDITRRDIQEVVQRIAERAPIMANRTLSLIRQVFHYGVNNAWFDLNPCQRIDKPGIERQRQRVLDVDEIQKLWNVLEHDTTTAGTILTLQLLTGQRIGELRQMQIEDVDLAAGWWTIPSEFAKNGIIHRIPLSPSALRMLKQRLETVKGRWVFPSPTDKSRPMGYPTIHYAVGCISERCSVRDPRWTPKTGH